MFKIKIHYSNPFSNYNIRFQIMNNEGAVKYALRPNKTHHSQNFTKADIYKCRTLNCVRFFEFFRLHECIFHFKIRKVYKKYMMT